MYRLFTIFILFGLQPLYDGIAFSNEECVFDENYYSKTTYATNARVKSLVWEDKNKVARILTQDGDLMVVQHWACRHLGVQAVMLLNSLDMSDEIIIRKKIRSLAELLVRPADFDEVVAVLVKMNCLQDRECKKTIPVRGYSEFYIQSERQQESMTILLKYYMS